jgi:hypothetical protein
MSNPAPLKKPRIRAYSEVDAVCPVGFSLMDTEVILPCGHHMCRDCWLRDTTQCFVCKNPISPNWSPPWVRKAACGAEVSDVQGHADKCLECKDEALRKKEATIQALITYNTRLQEKMDIVVQMNEILQERMVANHGSSWKDRISGWTEVLTSTFNEVFGSEEVAAPITSPTLDLAARILEGARTRAITCVSPPPDRGLCT